jgi:cell division protein FtsB
MESDLTISTGDCAKSEIAGISPALNFFLTTIENFLQYHKIFGPQIAQDNLSLLENIVRIGWVLNDIKRELKDGGAFELFIENRLPISSAQANAFAAESRRFKRDVKDLQFNAEVRKYCGLKPLLELNVFNAPLREQIAKLPASRFASLMRLSGLQKPRVSQKMLMDIPLQGMPRLQDKPAFLKVGAVLSRTWVRIQRISKATPIEELGDEERQAIARDLRPFVELYERINPNL